jgi:hypothetical protein
MNCITFSPKLSDQVFLVEPKAGYTFWTYIEATLVDHGVCYHFARYVNSLETTNTNK